MIYDTDGNRILSATFALRSGEVSTVSLLIDCLAGWQILGTAVSNLTVEVRHGADAYVDIETTPCPLDTWDGTQQQFDFRFTAGTITAATRASEIFTVSRG